MIRRTLHGNDSPVTVYAMKVFGRACFVLISGTKWYSGERFKRTPIWYGNMSGNKPTLFIGKVAIGYERKL